MNLKELKNSLDERFSEYISKIYFSLSICIIAMTLLFFIKRIEYGAISTNLIIGMAWQSVFMVVMSIMLGGCIFNYMDFGASTYCFIKYLFSLNLTFFFRFCIYAIDGITDNVFVRGNFAVSSLYLFYTAVSIVDFGRYFKYLFEESFRFEEIYMFISKTYALTVFLLLLFNIKYRLIFDITDGYFVLGSVGPVIFILGTLITASVFPSVVKRKTDKTEKTAVLIYIFLPLVGTLLGISYPYIPFGPLGLFVACCIMFVHGHMRLTQTIKNQEIEIQTQKNAILLSQIKPHFLYNSLSSIAMLCDSDPKKAKTVTMAFTKYLRGNLDSIASEQFIPFSDELRHTKAYLEIEKVRFDDRLTVEFDIQFEKFYMPSLCLQPIVENAVKYGACQREEGGRVTIASYADDNNIYIDVSDNGPGFDPDSVDWEDGSHIGIVNVRQRLERQCNANLVIHSYKGRGTQVEIVIPKEE